MDKIFDFWGQNIYVSDQAVFIVTYTGLNDRGEITIGDPLIEGQGKRAI